MARARSNGTKTPGSTNVPAPPRFTAPRATIDSFSGALDVFGASGVLTGFAGELDFEAVLQLSDLEIVNCSITGVSGRHSGAPPETVLEIENSAFADVDVSGWSLLSISGSEFHRSKLSGMSLERSLNDSRFAQCKLDACLIRFASLKRVEFEECSFLDADFHGSTLGDVRYGNCKISGVGFDRCEIERVDIRGSDLSEIADPRTLKGATIDTGQAISMAASLARRSGLIVDDGESEER